MALQCPSATICRTPDLTMIHLYLHMYHTAHEIKYRDLHMSWYIYDRPATLVCRGEENNATYIPSFFFTPLFLGYFLAVLGGKGFKL